MESPRSDEIIPSDDASSSDGTASSDKLSAEKLSSKAAARRRLLTAGAAAASSLILPRMAQAHLLSRPGRWAQRQMERALTLFNAQTGETFRSPYWLDGHYIHSAMQEINYLLRDHHNDQVKPINSHLIDTLYALNHLTGNRKPIVVTSGYRSPQTNNRLIAEGLHASPRSYHMRGMAADITVPGQSLAYLHRAALALRAGGVGYYPDHHFIHIDVGPVRTWEGGALA